MQCKFLLHYVVQALDLSPVFLNPASVYMRAGGEACGLPLCCLQAKGRDLGARVLFISNTVERDLLKHTLWQ